jgi:hypothetical protein
MSRRKVYNITHACLFAVEKKSNKNKTIILALILGMISAMGTSSIAFNYTKAASTTTPITNTSLVLGSPIYIAHDKITSVKPLLINGSHAEGVLMSGKATLKGVNVTESGTALLILRPDGSSDVRGQLVMTTSEGSEARAIFYAIGHEAPVNSTTVNGAAFLHTSGTTPKLASVNNIVLIIKSLVDKAGNLSITGWELK